MSQQHERPQQPQQPEAPPRRQEQVIVGERVGFASRPVYGEGEAKAFVDRHLSQHGGSPVRG